MKGPSSSLPSWLVPTVTKAQLPNGKGVLPMMNQKLRLRTCLVASILFVWLLTGLLIHANLVYMMDHPSVVTETEDDLSLKSSSRRTTWFTNPALNFKTRALGSLKLSDNREHFYKRVEQAVKELHPLSKKMTKFDTPTKETDGIPHNNPKLKTTSMSSAKKKKTNPKTPRQVFEETHDPNDMERLRQVTDNLRLPTPQTYPGNNIDESHASYNFQACPTSGPPAGYPMAWPLLQILHAWNPDDTTMPRQIHQGLCEFDWDADQEAVQRYREAEVPFVVRNHPDLMRTAERWMTHPTYLETLLGPEPQRNDHGANNHLMFWRLSKLQEAELNKQKEQGPDQPSSFDTTVADKQEKSKKTLTAGHLPPGWQTPTETVSLTYKEWYERAVEMDEKVASGADQASRDHYYLRINAFYENMNDYLYDELPMFHPEMASHANSLTVDVEDHRGINCRFGMKGTLAEAHFDPTRNWIALLGGQRRYILAHPSQCNHLNLFPQGHPSARHSASNWSRPDAVTNTSSPLFHATANEVVLQAADALYLPTSWFHFIVSLNRNYQCNSRSGVTTENRHFVQECGF